MSDEEANLMGRHAMYIQGLIDSGTIILAGPVDDPDGSWGVVVMQAASLEEATEHLHQDPVILSNQGFEYKIFPMLGLMR